MEETSTSVKDKKEWLSGAFQKKELEPAEEMHMSHDLVAEKRKWLDEQKQKQKEAQTKGGDAGQVMSKDFIAEQRKWLEEQQQSKKTDSSANPADAVMTRDLVAEKMKWLDEFAKQHPENGSNGEGSVADRMKWLDGQMKKQQESVRKEDDTAITRHLVSDRMKWLDEQSQKEGATAAASSSSTAADAVESGKTGAGKGVFAQRMKWLQGKSAPPPPSVPTSPLAQINIENDDDDDDDDYMLPDDYEDLVYDEESEKKCREMVGALTKEELEHAAMSSYHYSLSEDKTKTEREKYAMTMAFRHLVVCFGDPVSALERMKKTIQFRVTMDVDGIRTCFYSKKENDETKATFNVYREKIEAQLETGKMFVMGYDTRGCSIMPMISRNADSVEPEWYIKAHIYTLERAIACSERSTKGADSKVNIIMDYNGHQLKHTPPLLQVRRLLHILRDHYPGQLHQITIMDAPFSFKAFYTLVYGFIDPFTKRLIRFITGDEQKTEELNAEKFWPDELMPFMHPIGKKTKPLDVKAYLTTIPFDRAFDEEVPKSLLHIE